MTARSAFLLSFAGFIGLAGAGLGAVVLGVVGAARAQDPAIQLPYAVSGVIAGLGLVGAGCGLALVQRARWERARRVRSLVQVQRAVASLVVAVASR